MEPVVLLRPGRERSLLHRHPWLFAGAIASVDGDPAPGDTVRVVTARGDVLGRGAYSPHSQIRVRMWTFDPDVVVDDDFVAARVERAAARRATLLARPDSAARLVFSEADGLPGLTVDRYGPVVVLQLTSAGAERWRGVIASTLAALAGVTAVVERSDADVREREGLAPRTGVIVGGVDGEVTITEGAARFLVDVERGHKTGFYLDQRDSRAVVADLAHGRRVLNVFAYTGAFGVVAALNGAASVASIDSSAPALDVARRNAELNDVDAGEVVVGDAFTELRRLRDRARSFDLVILDPPKLAASAKQVDRASRAYKDLNLLGLKLLAPGGVLVTFSCSGAMTAELFQKVLAGAAVDATRDARIVRTLRQSADHPVPLAFPEAEYLKGFVLEA